jgi:tetratricopeptide (TPR) repeat protein
MRRALRAQSEVDEVKTQGVAMVVFIVERGALTGIFARASRMASRACALGLLVAGLAAVQSAPVLAQADSKAADALMAQAQSAMSKGRPDEAVPLLRKAIEMSPNRAELYMLRSRARDSSGKFEAALEDASKYIELAPNDPYGYLNRARVYMSLDKASSALEDANKAISLAPNEPDAYYRRADIYVDMGKNAEAKADEAKADELDKKAR